MAKGWEDSLALANETQTTAIPLHKLGDGDEENDAFAKENAFVLFFLLGDQKGNWHAFYNDHWEDIEEFMKENPNFTEVYYSEEDGMIWSEAYRQVRNATAFDYNCDLDVEYGILEKINDKNLWYYGPIIPTDLIYNGEVIMTVKSGG